MAKVSGSALDGDMAFKARVSSLVDLPHPAGTYRCDDFVWADPTSRCKTHDQWGAHHMAMITATQARRPLSIMAVDRAQPKLFGCQTPAEDPSYATHQL